MNATETSRLHPFRTSHLVLVCFALTQPWTQCIAYESPTVEGALDFSRDVIPLLTRAGCNSGACHGAAAGRGYLPLSLFGSRPGEDFESIVHSMRGGLVDVDRPDDSLLLLKPTEQLEHGGGRRLEEDSRAFAVLRAWIQQNAAPGALQPVHDIRLRPANQLAIRRGTQQAVSVEAEWIGHEPAVMPADTISVVGAEQSSSDSAPVTFVRTETQLQFTGHKVGYWPITLRVGAVAKSLAIWVTPETLGETNENSRPGSSTIDRISSNKISLLGISPASACSSTDLARRLWVDLLHRHPTKQEWQRAREEIDRRNLPELVDELLSTPEFSNAAAERISGWLRGASVTKRQPTATQLPRAIAERLETDDNLQLLFRDMLTVPVKGPADPLTDFHRLAAGPRERTELVATALMGVQMGCAKCHDHPLDKWTQDDYFAMAACWAPVQTDSKVVRIDGRTTTDLRTEQAAVALLPNKRPIGPDELADHELIDWLLADSNAYFTNNLVNRTWHWLIGGALVDPVNDFRSTNPPVAPKLLQHLGQDLQHNDYSLRSLVRLIVLSDGYSRRSDSEPTDLAVRLAAARRAKRIEIPIEQLALQMLELTSESSDRHRRDDSETMMVVNDSCTRAVACNDPLSEGLQLVSGPELSNIIRQGVLKTWRNQNTRSPLALLQDVHLRAFGTQASDAEKSSWKALIEDYSAGESAGKSPPGLEFAGQDVVEAIIWGWIVSDKFRALH
ncbi:MAG: DUF1549 domain-containing protein [Aureliella sp.]